MARSIPERLTFSRASCSRRLAALESFSGEDRPRLIRGQYRTPPGTAPAHGLWQIAAAIQALSAQSGKLQVSTIPLRPLRNRSLVLPLTENHRFRDLLAKSRRGRAGPITAICVNQSPAFLRAHGVSEALPHAPGSRRFLRAPWFCHRQNTYRAQS